MPDYMLTAYGKQGWWDIAVLGADDMHEAIRLAEKSTGCRVSHGRGSLGSSFDPSRTIDAATGAVTVHHARAARPQVVAGPPEVMAAISAAIKSNRAPRKTAADA